MALTFGSLCSRWLILPLTLFVSAFASAQMVDAQGKTIEVFQVDEAPFIDGFLNDEAWKSATAIEDFHQVNPEEYGPPSEKSSVYVVYTKDALFVAGRFQDSEPDEIVAMVLRQGDYSFGEDSVTIMIDPFNKSRSGYAFDLNPNGVRSQAVYENVTSENWSWHGISSLPPSQLIASANPGERVSSSQPPSSDWASWLPWGYPSSGRRQALAACGDRSS